MIANMVESALSGCRPVKETQLAAAPAHVGMQGCEAPKMRACWAWHARSQSRDTICTVARWSRRKVFAASSSAAVGAEPTCNITIHRRKSAMAAVSGIHRALYHDPKMVSLASSHDEAMSAIACVFVRL